MIVLSVLILQKDKAQNDLAVPLMVAADEMTVIVADTEEAAAEAVIVVIAADPAADTRKTMAVPATGLHIKVVTGGPIRAVRQPDLIKTEADRMQEESHGTRNKPGNRGKRRKGSKKGLKGLVLNLKTAVITE